MQSIGSFYSFWWKKSSEGLERLLHGKEKTWNDYRLGMAVICFWCISSKWKEKFEELIMALKAFGRDCLLLRSWLEKECLGMLQSFGRWSKPSDRFICLSLKHFPRPTLDFESSNAVHQADLLLLPYDRLPIGKKCINMH